MLVCPIPENVQAKPLYRVEHNKGGPEKKEIDNGQRIRQQLLHTSKIKNHFRRSGQYLIALPQGLQKSLAVLVVGLY